MPKQDRKIRITYVITRAETGGSQMHVIDLLEGFRSEADLDLITGEEGPLTESARSLRIRVRVLPELVQPISPFNDLRAASALIGHLRTGRPDLVHAHTSKAGILTRIAAAVTDTPAVFTAHTWAFAEGTSAMWKLVGLPSERLAAQFTACIINVSEANRRLAAGSGIDKAKLSLTVHNGIRDTSFRADPQEPTARPQIVAVGRFVKQKDQQLLVQAMTRINQPYKLVFVGEGPTRAVVEADVARAGLQSQIVFAGNSGEVEQILSQSHIFVLPSRWEGFPLTILEAMRAGLPVIASDVGGVGEAVIDGHTGFLASPGDAHDLQRHIDNLLQDHALRGTLGDRGRRRFLKLFTRDRMLNSTRSIYHQIWTGSPLTDEESPGNAGFDARRSQGEVLQSQSHIGMQS
jgi:glycosyltransferase involved in cell wall biosynthesis